MAFRKESLAPKSANAGESITVAVRMRPLQRQARRVWKVMPEHASITQTIPDGGSLPNSVPGKHAFTFDQTFGEDTETSAVYGSVAKRIVSSCLSGCNGTIFAYGQTSSGKTYTMQGSGSIQDGSLVGDGGVVHMAAKDIFDHVKGHPERSYTIRASFLEIYNEEVRDLLSPSNEMLPIREDKKRGVFVKCVEHTVSTQEELLEILFEGEKSRAVASTDMNERSSRSHTIFRVAVGSQADSEDKENEGGCVRASILHLVDLAGSESSRHTGASGDRQKEGGMINQSLLTLSRVIGALGKQNKSHVNFRDSKLTRLLQPALSGNARIAVICCATPSEMYLEETRTTLQFAARAKLVKTNAKVNEIVDDKAIIRSLKQELAEARRARGNPIEEGLVAKVSTADFVASEAIIKLARLKTLSSQLLFQRDTPKKITATESNNRTVRRRYSDDFLQQTPVRGDVFMRIPTTEPRPTKKQKVGENKPVHVEFNLIRDALTSKSRTIEILKSTVDEYSRLFQQQQSETPVSCTEDNDFPVDLYAALEESRQLKERVIRQEEQNAVLGQRIKRLSNGNYENEQDCNVGMEIFANPTWPESSRVVPQEIPAGHSIDMKSTEAKNFCIFEYGSLNFLVSKKLAETAICAFKNLFLPPVGGVLQCPYIDCTFQCRNPTTLHSHMEKTAATGGGVCSNETTGFSQRGPTAFFLHEHIVALLTRCAQTKNIAPKHLLNPEAIPVAFGPTARHRWEGCSEELSWEKKMMAKMSSRFPHGLLENMFQEKEAWFIQQEAKRQKKKQEGDTFPSKRPKQYPHLLTMAFLKLPRHWP